MKKHVNEPGDPLTDRQREVFDYIRLMAYAGLSPTLREIAAECYSGRSAYAAVRQCCEAISRKGYIKVRRGEDRGLVITEMGRRL
tara:strand:- start:30 stop:284 length:255 start_codon:yes stop_codon:yes gene_type:complete